MHVWYKNIHAGEMCNNSKTETKEICTCKIISFKKTELKTMK